MKGLFWILALFALAVGISLAFNINEGYLLLVLPPYRTEISLNLAIIALVLGFALLYGFVRAAAMTLSLPQRAREFRVRRAREKSERVFGEAFHSLFEGNSAQTMKKAAEVCGNRHAGPFAAFSALLAARAAQMQGDAEQQKAWLERAVQEDPRTEPASLILAAGMCVETKHFDEALGLLDRLRELPSGAATFAAQRLKLKACQGAARWDDVLPLTRQLENLGGMASEAAMPIKEQAHAENIMRKQSSLAELQDYLKTIPVDEQSSTLDCHIAEAMLKLDANEVAAAFISKRLTKAWNSQLAGLYGVVKEGDVTARIARADAWLPEHRDDPQLLLALGRMCLEQQLWGKAQTYLDAALSVAGKATDKQQILLELAHYCEATERSEDAAAHYRAALSARDDAPMEKRTLFS